MKKVFVVGHKYPYQMENAIKLSGLVLSIDHLGEIVHQGVPKKKIADKFGSKMVIQAKSKNGNNDNFNKI